MKLPLDLFVGPLPAVRANATEYIGQQCKEHTMRSNAPFLFAHLIGKSRSLWQRDAAGHTVVTGYAPSAGVWSQLRP
jgi:hypothetical protein